MASEEDAVAFGAELGEVGVGRRWVGFEVEAVSGFRRRGGGNSDSRRTLEEIAAELVRRVAESEHAAGDATPLDFHRLDDGVENAEGVRRVEAVGDDENVEHGA